MERMTMRAIRPEKIPVGFGQDALRIFNYAHGIDLPGVKN